MTFGHPKPGERFAKYGQIAAKARILEKARKGAARLPDRYLDRGTVVAPGDLIDRIEQVSSNQPFADQVCDHHVLAFQRSSQPKLYFYTKYKQTMQISRGFLYADDAARPRPERRQTANMVGGIIEPIVQL